MADFDDDTDDDYWKEAIVLSKKKTEKVPTRRSKKMKRKEDEDDDFVPGESEKEVERGDLNDEEELSQTAEVEDDSSSPEKGDRKEGDQSNPVCKYGVNCFQKNPLHLQKFSHPSKTTIQNDRQNQQPKRQQQRQSKDKSECRSSSSLSQDLPITPSASAETPQKASESDADTEEDQDLQYEGLELPDPQESDPELELCNADKYQEMDQSEKSSDALTELENQLSVGISEDHQQIEDFDSEEESQEEMMDENDHWDSPPPLPEQPIKLPPSYKDAWDDQHVRLPCSPASIVVYRGVPISRWTLIQQSLLEKKILSSRDLELAIIKYRLNGSRRFNMNVLHSYLREYCKKRDRFKFFSFTLPHIIHRALCLPSLLKRPIPLLVSNSANVLMLSQKQISSLLANAFLCTLPPQGSCSRLTKSFDYLYQDLNFSALFHCNEYVAPPNQAAKLKCIITYFDRIFSKEPLGVVSFERLILYKPPKWLDSKTLIRPIQVSETALIEDSTDFLQADFANQMIGGGVIGSGCIQEEIRFVISPELLASLLFTARMEAHEAVLIRGSERFSSYSGYGRTFEFVGPYFDNSPTDSMKRKKSFVVAFDAIEFGTTRGGRLEQYHPEMISRELNKAFCAFSRTPQQLGYEEEEEEDKEYSSVPLATGNWGCGNFGGFHDLKALIQIVAAAEAGRSVLYCTFGETSLKSLSSVIEYLVSKKKTVSDVFRELVEFAKIVARREKERNSLLAKIRNMKEMKTLHPDQYEESVFDLLREDLSCIPYPPNLLEFLLHINNK